MLDPTTEALLGHFRHEHLPPHLAAVSRRIGDVARDLVAGAPELAAIRLMSAAHDLRGSLPVGPELAEGLALLADAAEGLPGDVAAHLRALANTTAADVERPADPDLYRRLRVLLRAKDALVRAEVGRPKTSKSALQRDVRREG